MFMLVHLCMCEILLKVLTEIWELEGKFL
jgi:hypothetical protein